MTRPIAPYRIKITLQEHYRTVRAVSDEIASRLSAEDAVVQSMPDASPTKWHLGHTTWFFETVVLSKISGYRIFDPAYAYLFNSYYEAVGPRHPRPLRGLITRPSLDDVYAYRAHVDRAMAKVLEDGNFADVVVLGLNHEQQHQELMLTDIKHAFFQNPTFPSFGWEEAVSSSNCTSAWSHQPGGIVDVGADFGSTNFLFDNECPRHPVLLQPYRIAKSPVTNREFIAFMDDGGYRKPGLWLSDGWAAATAGDWQHPLYWHCAEDGRWLVFTLAGFRPVNLDAPVQHVSFYEAAAFAAWSGKRLPTEFEWEVASADFSYGQVWEWTRSAYDPYPGFKTFSGLAAEYNGKFMVGQLVLRGGSIATPHGHARPTYRNFFPPHIRWQFSGIRLAQDA